MVTSLETQVSRTVTSCPQGAYVPEADNSKHRQEIIHEMTRTLKEINRVDESQVSIYRMDGWMDRRRNQLAEELPQTGYIIPNIPGK